MEAEFAAVAVVLVERALRHTRCPLQLRIEVAKTCLLRSELMIIIIIKSFDAFFLVYYLLSACQLLAGAGQQVL